MGAEEVCAGTVFSFSGDQYGSPKLSAEKKKASSKAGLTLYILWWAHTDSNRGPKDYEAVKSTFLVVSQRLPKKSDLARYPKFKGLGVSPWFRVWPVMP